MVKLIWSETAIEDLKSIHEYIALDSPKYATQFTNKLIERIDQLEEFPRSGRVVPEFNNQDIRELIEGQYRIFYKVFSDHILIARIHHSSKLIN